MTCEALHPGVYLLAGTSAATPQQASCPRVPLCCLLKQSPLPGCPWPFFHLASPCQPCPVLCSPSMGVGALGTDLRFHLSTITLQLGGLSHTSKHTRHAIKKKKNPIFRILGLIQTHIKCLPCFLSIFTASRMKCLGYLANLIIKDRFSDIPWTHGWPKALTATLWLEKGDTLGVGSLRPLSHW